MSLDLFDNIAWHALTGEQARFAAGRGAARRYARGFSPIVGFEDPSHPDFDALREIVDPGEAFYCDGWNGPSPPDLRIEADTTMYKMFYAGGMPEADEAPDAVALGPAHVEQALDLVELTHPGPFGPRTLELGDYFGIVQDGRLVAMAGERFHAGTLREISGVCTHPAHQGRGYARRLMRKLVRQQMARGFVPVLHVIRNNTNALELYKRMGFRVYAESPVRLAMRAA
ncbi:MAG: GNAT family N-acetyltransferase [Burkholderiales bacterium]